MSPPPAGRQPRRQPVVTSFWRFNLRHEWTAAAAAGLVLVGASVLSLQQLQSRYLELQETEANQVNHHLQLHLDEASHQLDAFSQLPAARWQRDASLLLPSFSDLYELGDQLEVRRVLMGGPGSRVFPGFSFAGTAIRPYLNGGGRSGLPGASPIGRGLEDEMASIYVLREAQGRRLLGRIQLSYIQSFLQRYSTFSGTPVLLVSRDGFVMLSGSEQLRVASIDLHMAAARGGRLEPLHLKDRTWLPVVSNDSVLGARVVTLLPDDSLKLQRQVLLVSSGAVLLLTALVFGWKNLRLRRLLFTPVARFADQIKVQELRLRQGIPALPGAGGAAPASPAMFRELDDIQTSFERLLSTIAERDRALLASRQRQQRQEEEQRRQLQAKLHSSLMAAAIAHEINLPLSTIRLLCERARMQLQQDSGALDVEALVSTLSQQSQQVSAVVEKMRMLLRNVQTDPHPTDLAAVLQGASKAVKPLLRQHQVQLECHGLEPGADSMVPGDAVQLQMAVSNLLRNGIEAAAERPQGERRVRLRLTPRSGEQVVDVSDSGPGFSVDPSDATVLQSSKPGGSGLGLFVVRTTVANHGGRLRFGRCGDLGGARVWVHLPTAEA